MKRISFLLIVLPLLMSCKNPSLQENTHHLYKDFPFSETLNFVRPKDPAFEASFGWVRGKRYPALAQNQPGAIAFYHSLQNSPTLTFSLQFQQRKNSNLEARVVVESDHPLLKKEFEVQPGENHSIDLSSFEGRIVRITFQAKSRNLIGLGGFLYWIDPMIQQVQEQLKPVHAELLQSVRERQRHHNVLIFLLDATNPTHLGCYGYSKPTSPVIDSIAAEGVIFDNAIAQAVSTLPSTGSLMTGLYPEAHGVLGKRSVLPDTYKTMAEFFREAGFRTALFSANPNASPISGYHQGFEEIWSLREGRPISADEFIEPFERWIQQVRHHRFFGYLHIREPHWPYRPPRQFMDRFHQNPAFDLRDLNPFVIPPVEEQARIRAAYDANLAFADAQLGTMLGLLRSMDLFDNTIIVILADHGEAFWQHGKQGHNHQVTEDTARIPLIIRFPGEHDWQGKREPYVVGSIDLLPTFADIFSFSSKELSYNGQSLLPFMVSQKVPTGRYRLTQTSSQSLYGIRSDEFKYIYHAQGRRSEDEFFHLVSDPNERVNAIQEYPISSAYYRTELKKTLKQLERFRSASKQNAVIDRETEEELQALGYVN